MRDLLNQLNLDAREVHTLTGLPVSEVQAVLDGSIPSTSFVKTLSTCLGLEARDLLAPKPHLDRVKRHLSRLRALYTDGKLSKGAAEALGARERDRFRVLSLQGTLQLDPDPAHTLPFLTMKALHEGHIGKVKAYTYLDLPFTAPLPDVPGVPCTKEDLEPLLSPAQVAMKRVYRYLIDHFDEPHAIPFTLAPLGDGFKATVTPLDDPPFVLFVDKKYVISKKEF
jgi:hypothetical protein